MLNIKYIFLLIVTIIGSPFHQLGAYMISNYLGFGELIEMNTYQVNSFAFTIALLIIFFIRLAIYSKIYCSIDFPFSIKGKSSFLYIFFQRHIYQTLSVITFIIWTSALEGNIIALVALPFTFLLGLIVSIITFVRILKIKTILEDTKLNK